MEGHIETGAIKGLDGALQQIPVLESSTAKANAIQIVALADPAAHF